jgi:hypothetical protein
MFEDLKEKLEISKIKDGKLREFVTQQLYTFRDNVLDFIDDNTPKDKSRRGRKVEVKEEVKTVKKLTDELYSLRRRMSRLDADSYKELANYTRIKVARIVDYLQRLVNENVVGAMEYNELVAGIEETFNSTKPRRSEFNMKKVRKDYEKLLFEFIDELKLEERD